MISSFGRVWSRLGAALVTTPPDTEPTRLKIISSTIPIGILMMNSYRNSILEISDG
jgi:hypothetical protein